MNVVNSIVTLIADLVFRPLAQWPFWDLVFCSAVMGLLFTLAFRCLSPQRRLAVIRDRISGNMLAISIFQDDLVTTLQCTARIGGCVILRLIHWVPALLVLAIPMTLILSQFAARYQHRPLTPGESTIVEVEFTADAWERYSNLSIHGGQNLSIDTPAVHDAEHKTVAWRISAIAPGKTVVRWRLDDTELLQEIAVADDPSRLVSVIARRPGPGVWDRLINPSQRAFAADSPVQSILVHYPERMTPFWIWNIPWWLTFTTIYLITAMLAGWRWNVVF